MAYITMTGQAFDSLADLALQAGTEGVVVYVAYGVNPDDRGGGNYRWSSTAVNTADGINYIQVSGMSVGRWTRMRNNNYSTGTFSITVALLTLTYTVSHGLPYIPSGILLEALSQQGAIGDRWISNINATTFTVNYRSLPLAGLATYFYTAIR